MILTTGEPNHIEDYLITVRNGQWFGWTDSKNKIYENLIVHDGGYKPTKDEVDAGYQALKDNWTNTKYVRDRQAAYPYFSGLIQISRRSLESSFAASIKLFLVIFYCIFSSTIFSTNRPNSITSSFNKRYSKSFYRSFVFDRWH